MGSTPELLPADTFDGYELGDIAGPGIAGEVWNARHTESGVDVAVEVIGAPLATDAEFRRRLSTEVDRATVLDDPAIASVYEVLASGTRVGVVTDSLPPKRADALSRDDGLPIAAALFIAEAVLLAMSAAHRAGVVHGAIEPRVISVEGARVLIGGFAVGRALRPQAPADPSTDTRAVARLVVDLAAGSAAARYATLPRQVRVVLARAAAAKRERHYRTAAGMRSALVNAARRDLGDDWRERAAAQLKALSAAPAGHASPSMPVPRVAREASGVESATAELAPREVSEQGPAPVTPVIRAVPGDLARPRTTPARSLRLAGMRLSLAAVALGVGVAGAAVAFALRGTSPAPATPLTVRLSSVSLQVEPVRGSCNSVFVVTATGAVRGSGTLLYRWARSDGEQSASTALPVSGNDGSFLITEHWQLSGQVGTPSITFQLLSPVSMTLTRPLQYSCP